MIFDLLSTVEYGGCSAKIPQGELSKLLSDLQPLKSANIMVDISTHDDAGVYKLNDETALIVTTDFFPPVCSDGYEFGEIAAANSLSDVYAMGGKPLLVLNLNMFPATKIPLEVLAQILDGGVSKINEAGALVMGGHTIEDYPPKYGLAVVGICHPDKLTTNSGFKVGQKLILTKPLGTGVILAAQRAEICDNKSYRSVIESMKALNKISSEIMIKYGVTGCTDITGFGLAGHVMNMAKSSDVSIQINIEAIPIFDNVMQLLEDGCVPGAVFRNMEHNIEDIHYDNALSPQQKYITCDAQTSGGLLIGVDSDKADALLNELKSNGISSSTIIGEVISTRDKRLYFY